MTLMFDTSLAQVSFARKRHNCSLTHKLKVTKSMMTTVTTVQRRDLRIVSSCSTFFTVQSVCIQGVLRSLRCLCLLFARVVRPCADLVHGREAEGGPVLPGGFTNPQQSTHSTGISPEPHSGDKPEEEQRRACDYTLDGAGALVATPARAVKVTCNKVDMMCSHESLTFEHQIKRSVKCFGALVLHAEARDAEGGLTITWLSSMPGPSSEALKCPAELG